MALKAVRQIVEIDEEKCDGCGLCVPACAEGAIQIIDGKAKLVSETYCDGLGACLGHCPQDAITIVEREAARFDEKEVEKHLAHEHEHQCPSSQPRTFEPRKPSDNGHELQSQITNWPIQIMLAPPVAPYFENADLLIAADCVPFAYANFHNLLEGKVVLIGCPKLDDFDHYVEKLTGIITQNNIKSLTVAHMEVPCCFGLDHLVGKAVENSGKNISVQTEVFAINGEKL